MAGNYIRYVCVAVAAMSFPYVICIVVLLQQPSLACSIHSCWLKSPLFCVLYSHVSKVATHLKFQPKINTRALYFTLKYLSVILIYTITLQICSIIYNLLPRSLETWSTSRLQQRCLSLKEVSRSLTLPQLIFGVEINETCC